MKALRFEKTGSLDELKMVDLPPPVPGPGEVLVKVHAAAINPSDVKNVLGKMHETSTPRIPGRDFAGVVLEGPPELLGRQVFGAGGNLGFGRDGTHAELVALPAGGVNPMPGNLTFPQAAAMGVAYMTAWAAVVTAANIQPGETILITGATGAVGGAAAKIAHAKGARVIGIVRKAEALARAKDGSVDQWIALDAGELPASVLAITGGKGVNAVFDVVGGALFEPCLKSLALRGRQVAIASNPDPRVSFNLVDFYHRESRIIGLDSLKLGFEESSAILRGLTPGIEAGTYPPPAVQTRGLDAAIEAYREVAEGRVKEKLILVP
ncbi:MAG TPA: zinc-binding alcohol dehydrogenase family protein [Chthoniobacteraceae bacterium]|jgi:NADPH:quinone reductase-like Zn-dependent oxidoreductase|nr:zinc-binding alcohol dehydrogenase family protein [Chthoniobacteraceae bacterium]